MSLQRVATRKPDHTSGNAIEMVLDGEEYSIKYQVIEAWTEEQMQAFARTYLDRDDIWVHRNDDDSVAVAIGDELDFWPEDDPDG